MSVFDLEPPVVENPVKSRVMYVYHEGLIQYLYSSGAVAEWLAEANPEDLGYGPKDKVMPIGLGNGVYVDEGKIVTYHVWPENYDECDFKVTNIRLATQDEWCAFLNDEYVFEDEYQASRIK